MSDRREIAPGWALQVEDSTEHHWLATCGTVVVLVLHEGTADDPGHIQASARLLARSLRLRAPKHQFLAVFPPTLGRPPSERVRRALSDAGSVSRTLDRSAAVILGQGFLPSIHRGVITGVLTLLRAPIETKVVSTIREGVTHVVGTDDVAIAALTRVCEERVADVAAGRVATSV